MNEMEVMQTQMDRKKRKLNEHWIVLDHAEAIEVMRRMRFLTGKQPILIVLCERRPNVGEHIYEYFVPVSMTIRPGDRLVDVHGTIGPNGARQTLRWSPDKQYDDSGTYISYVITLPQYYPGRAIDAVELAPVSFE